MWSAQTERLSGGRILKVSIQCGTSPMMFAEVLSGWHEDAEFRSFFVSLLSATPFVDFRWETPPITTTLVRRPFEFVLLDSPGLASAPDVAAFAEHFGGCVSGDGVVSFSNLGKDAILVVPCPITHPMAYRHLGAFLREATESQKHALWQAVATATLHALGPAPIWLSTAGAGVSWLHVRIDQKPKYYVYEPYRRP